MAKNATKKRTRIRLQMKRPLDWLLWASLLFQGTACALLVFKSGSPDWVAAALTFFASPGASFCTGSVLVCDGGATVGGL